MGSAINLSEVAVKIPPEEARVQQEVVADLLGRHNTGFPGAQPVSFARHHLERELLDKDYFMCEKTDGIRCLLFLHQYVDEAAVMHESHFLIDRKNDYYYISDDQLHIPSYSQAAPGYNLAGFHVGTLLDGELVRQRMPGGGSRLAYLIFDMLALDGESITAKPFDKRLARVKEYVEKPYRRFAAEPRYADDISNQVFTIKMKDMDFPYSFKMMFEEKIPRLPHGNDGLIFTCKDTPYEFGTDKHILKWKPPHENTVDFKMQIESFPVVEDEDGPYENFDAMPEISLMVNHGSGGYEYFAMLKLTTEEWERMKEMNQQFDHRIIECYRDAATGQWRPKIEDDGTPRFRDDKTDGNHISVVQSVLESIKDAVTEEDLIEQAERIRAAYKGRQRRREEEGIKEAAAAKEAECRRLAAAAEAAKDDGPRYD